MLGKIDLPHAPEPSKRGFGSPQIYSPQLTPRRDNIEQPRLSSGYREPTVSDWSVALHALIGLRRIHTRKNV